MNDLPRMTIIRTVVEQDEGRSVRNVGIARVTRTRPGENPIVRTFDPPSSELLDIDWDALSDDDLSNLPGGLSLRRMPFDIQARDEAGSGVQPTSLPAVF